MEEKGSFGNNNDKNDDGSVKISTSVENDREEWQKPLAIVGYILVVFFELVGIIKLIIEVWDNKQQVGAILILSTFVLLFNYWIYHKFLRKLFLVKKRFQVIYLIFSILLLAIGIILIVPSILELGDAEPTIKPDQTEETLATTSVVETTTYVAIAETDEITTDTPTPEPAQINEFSSTDENLGDNISPDEEEIDTVTTTPDISLDETEPTQDNLTEDYYEYISIGLINLGELWGCSMNESIKPYLEQTFGFTVELISLNSEISEMQAFDVVYLPYGWSCAEEDFKERATHFQEYTNYGGGLLIGNPNLNPEINDFKVTIFHTNLIYSHSQVTNTSGKKYPENENHRLLENYPESYLPIPEVGLVISNHTYLDVLVQGKEDESYSLIVYDEQKFEHFENLGRALILTGGELPESEHQLEESVMLRFIRWLAKDIN